MMQILGSTLMIIGALLALLAGIGLVRLPTALTRLHAAAKAASMGLVLVAIGAGIAASSVALVGIGVLVAVFQFLTAPVAGHLLGRSLEPTDEAEITVDEPLEAGGGRRWGLIIQASVVWVVLWRDFTLANVLAGMGIGLVLALVAPPRTNPSYARPLAAVGALVRYIVSLAGANARMTYQILAVPDDELQETTVVCDLETRIEAVAFFDANATSFAPGTLTLEISSRPPYQMLVHAVGRTADEVRADVAELEASTARVFS